VCRVDAIGLVFEATRDIDIDCATTDLGGHSPAVQVTAYGATPITVSA
jgi:hypothetical protein